MNMIKQILSIILIFFVAGLISITNCTVNDDPYEYAKWNFSGYVRDGSSGERLKGVEISYLDDTGIRQNTSTDSMGNFYISGLAYGEKSFLFSYFCTLSDKRKIVFTSKNIKVASYNESSTMEGVIGNKSEIVTLFPMNSTVSGKVYVQLAESGEQIAVDSAQVEAVYQDSSFVKTSSDSFKTITDKNGRFQLVNLPASGKVALMVSNYLYDNINYAAERISLPELMPENETVIENIYMKPVDSTDSKVHCIASNVLTRDGFGMVDIPVDMSLWYIFSEKPDTSSISVTFREFPEFKVSPVFHKDTLFIVTSSNLPYDSLITVDILGMDRLKRQFRISFDGIKRFRTQKSISVLSSNVLSSDGYGLTNVRVNINPWYVLSRRLSQSALTVKITGLDSSEILPTVKGDTLFVKHFQNLPKDKDITVIINGLDNKGSKVQLELDSIKRFHTEQGVTIVHSNVLTVDGYGMTGIPVNITPYYVLSDMPKADFMDAELENISTIDVTAKVKKDTVFILHGENFPSNTAIAVHLTGVDTAGNKIDILLSGAKQFQTRRFVYAIESNTWRSSKVFKNEFSLYDTLWVKFSQKLNKSKDLIKWYSSTVDNIIYGNGNNQNAEIKINNDTLFVIPDQRLAVEYGETMGFNVSVLSESGEPSESTFVSVDVIKNEYSVVWTNTKDMMGNLRVDMGVLDTVYVVSNKPVKSIVGVSGFSDRVLPKDLILDNIKLHGDTIIYVPKIAFEADVVYGIDFDIIDNNGIKRSNELGVVWRCYQDIGIVSVNNRSNGIFREFKSHGDSLVVQFSKAVNISSSAPVPFTVNMHDVTGSFIQTTVSWNTAKTLATIHITDYLPVADFNAPLGNTSTAKNSRAVDRVTFDLTAVDGELAYGLSPLSDSIEIHTEDGLVPIQSNILSNHNSSYEIDKTEIPVSDFPATGSIRITFNRALDVTEIKSKGDSLFAGIIEVGAYVIPSSVSFEDANRTIVITPDSSLSSSKKYNITLNSVPALTISKAKAINKHAGRYSSQGKDNRFLDQPFGVKP